MSSKKLLLFDLGNVLIKEVHPKLFDLIYYKMDDDKISRDRFDKKISDIISDSFYGKISLKETWEKIFDLSKLDKESFESIKNSVNVNDYNKELIKSIKSLNIFFDFGIASDLSQIGYHVVRQNLDDFFVLCNKKNIFISIFCGLTKVKNGRDFFKMILGSVKYKPEDIIFIDDNINLIKLSLDFGINGVLFEHENKNDSWDGANKCVLNKIKKYAK